MNPKIKELQRKIDNAVTKKQKMITLSLLEELRAEQDKEEKLILQKIKQEKRYDINTNEHRTVEKSSDEKCSTKVRRTKELSDESRTNV